MIPFALLLCTVTAPSTQAPAPAATTTTPATTTPAPALEVDIGPGIFNGRISRIDVKAPSPIASLTASLASKPAIVFPVSSDGAHWALLAPLDIEWTPKTAPLSVEAKLVDGTKLKFDRRMPVTTAPYRESHVTVDKQFTAPSAAQQERASIESRILDEAVAHSDKERLWRGSFQKPVPGEETSPFGAKRIYSSDGGPTKYSRHFGWDLDGKIGDDLVASNRGRVVLAADRFYSGGTVIIDHGQGLITMYFHMSRIDVLAGDIVEKGQHLGAVGMSGQVTGPHVHFVVKLDNTSQDARYLVGMKLDDDGSGSATSSTASPASPASQAATTATGATAAP